MDNKMTYNDLLKSIEHWNEYRVPILRISQPDKNLEFQGAMRFYFQDAGQKVATKCVNVTSVNTTKDVIDVLIEKFRPDMRMLSVPEYGLYEIHENGDERKLSLDERPLFVQLEWNKDDREGRFLLRRMDEKTRNLTAQNEEPSLKRKLSKKEKKKQDKIRKQHQKEHEQANLKSSKVDSKNVKNGIAQRLYNELPETSFTRSISNPEAVMKRRRAQKLEKRLQEFSLEGGKDAGGTLRIFGESINKDIAYKTILVSNRETAAYVVRQTLEKYGKDKEDPTDYCLIQVIVPPSATSGSDNNSVHNLNTSSSLLEYILEDHDCPLSILQNHDNSKGILTFHIRRKPADYHKRRKKKPLKIQVLPTAIQPTIQPAMQTPIQHTTSELWKGFPRNEPPQAPEILDIHLRKKNNQLGLSIIAVKGFNQESLGTYIKNVVKNGAAASDGRLQAGDQLLEVDNIPLANMTQDEAAELIQRTGQVLTLKILKNAANYHNLSDVIDSASSQSVASPQAVIPPPNFAQQPSSSELQQQLSTEKKYFQPSTIHPPPMQPIDRFLIQPQEIPRDPRLIQFQPMYTHMLHQQNMPQNMPQNMQQNIQLNMQNLPSNIQPNIPPNMQPNMYNFNGNHIQQVDKVHPFMYPERQVHFQPPPPQKPNQMNHHYSPSNVMINYNHVSPPKSPKKVSWVDTQPHQSLHTLIPPSPAPIPSPTSAQAPSPSAEMLLPPSHFEDNYRDYYKHNHHYNNHNFSHDQLEMLNQHRSHPQHDDDDEDEQEDEQDEEEEEDEEEENNNSNYKHTQITTNGQASYVEKHQLTSDHKLGVDALQPPTNAPPNNPQLDTTTESLTLEDIDEVLSSKTHNNWLEDSAGVIGTQEVYNDPRQRIVKERQRPNEEQVNIEKLSFQEKLKMFNISAKK